jgi:hypothetical protein
LTVDCGAVAAACTAKMIQISFCQYLLTLSSKLDRI